MPRYQRAPNGDYDRIFLEEDDESPSIEAVPSASEAESWASRYAPVLIPSLLVGAYFFGRWWQARGKDIPTSWTP